MILDKSRVKINLCSSSTASLSQSAAARTGNADLLHADGHVQLSHGQITNLPRPSIAEARQLGIPYHPMDLRSRKNFPLSFGDASVANHIAVSAPSSTDREALAPPMSVRTQPGHIEYTAIPSERRA